MFIYPKNREMIQLSNCFYSPEIDILSKIRSTHNFFILSNLACAHDKQNSTECNMNQVVWCFHEKIVLNFKWTEFFKFNLFNAYDEQNSTECTMNWVVWKIVTTDMQAPPGSFLFFLFLSFCVVFFDTESEEEEKEKQTRWRLHIDRDKKNSAAHSLFLIQQNLFFLSFNSSSSTHITNTNEKKNLRSILVFLCLRECEKKTAQKKRNWKIERRCSVELVIANVMYQWRKYLLICKHHREYIPIFSLSLSMLCRTNFHTACMIISM